MRPVLIGLLVPLLLARPAPTQDLSARQQEFMKQFKSLLELQDLRGISQLVAKDVRSKDATAEGIIDQYCFQFALTGDAQKLEDVRLLANAVDEVEQNGPQPGRFAKRFDLLKSLSEEQRPDWIRMRNAWVKAAPEFATALQKKDQTEFRRALVDLEDVAKAAAELKDPEIEAVALYDIGMCHENLGDTEEVVSTYDKGMDVWVAAGRPKDNFYEHMKAKRAELMEQKAHAEAAAETPAEGAPASSDKKSSTTSYKEGADWEEWTTEYREMKDPFTPGSTSPWCTEQVLLWREFGWVDGPHPFGSLVRAAPFGRELTVVKDGSKGFFDVDGDKKETKADSPVKVIDGKPTLNVVRSGEGKDADSYAFFMLSGGQSQTWFQAPINFSTKGLYRAGCYREGKILGETVLFLDDNCDGAIGAATEQRDNLLRDAPTWIDDDGIIIGKGRPIPWSDVVGINEKWYAIKPVDPHAKKVRTRELDIQSGQILLKWNGPVQPRALVLAEVRDFKGSYFDVSGGKPVPVPVGRYEIAFGHIETGKGMQDQAGLDLQGRQQADRGESGRDGHAEMGAPYTLDIVTKDEGKTLLVKGKTMLVKEKTGAIVGRIFDEIPFPEVTMRAKGGSTLGRPASMTRISTEQFNKDNSSAWFPADLELKKAEKQEVEVQFNLKKPHPLLGGPFTSEWK